MPAPAAVLIGFQYSRSTQERLVGTIVDLYRAYRYSQRIGCQDVIILTDILRTDFPLEIVTAIAEKVADGGIISFLQTYPALVINTADDFRSALQRIPDVHQLVAYYSGHGKNHALVLPDGSSFDMQEFRDVLLEHIDENGELFCIVDCCHSHGLFLPFVFERDHFRLRQGYLNFLRPRVLLLTSTQEHRDSQSTHLGSVFSRYLFDWLNLSSQREVGLRLSHLRQDVSQKMHEDENSQHIGIYASWKETPLLWPWTTGRLDWNVDLKTGCFRLSRNETSCDVMHSPSATLCNMTRSPDVTQYATGSIKDQELPSDDVSPGTVSNTEMEDTGEYQNHSNGLSP